MLALRDLDYALSLFPSLPHATFNRAHVHLIVADVWSALVDIRAEQRVNASAYLGTDLWGGHHMAQSVHLSTSDMRNHNSHPIICFHQTNLIVSSVSAIFSDCFLKENVKEVSPALLLFTPLVRF